MNLYPIFKTLAFKIDPEVAHNRGMALLSNFPWLASFWRELYESDKYSLKLGELTLPFPIGLAAGLDKNGEAVDFFTQLPFGFIEVGTVTPLPQPGNERPRLFRLKDEFSLRNSMGFNNEGMDSLYENLLHAKKNGKPVGINIGKNKTTPIESAWSDYQKLYDKFAPVADYLVINISSPNTPGLRDLGSKESFKAILEALSDSRKRFSCPLFVKISPDQNFFDVSDLLKLLADYSVDGVIATNTTIMPELGGGGISGRLLKEKSKKMRSFVLKEIKGSPLSLIGVGGVESFTDLLDFWKEGGRVMQVYTSFIYQGPSMLLQIKREIDIHLKREGVSKLSELFK